MKITRRSLLAGAPLAAGLIAAGLPRFASAEAAPVKFRYLASRGSISPHELAYELGYLKDLGIELENVGYAAGGPESLFALSSGSVDLGSAATAAVINSISGGNDFVAAY
ncbi:MAG: ABC transporter substrate-binding protein, partial [Bradyrhizobium sp.]